MRKILILCLYVCSQYVECPLYFDDVMGLFLRYGTVMVCDGIHQFCKDGCVLDCVCDVLLLIYRYVTEHQNKVD